MLEWAHLNMCLFLCVSFSPVSGKNPAHIRVPPKFLDVIRSIGSQTTYLTRVDFLTTVTFRGTTPFLTAPMSRHSPDRISASDRDRELTDIPKCAQGAHLYK